MRRKIEIKLIDDKSKRHTTFTKRRKGLMSKAEEFCRKSDSKVVFLAFSGAGNSYGFGHPDVQAVLEHYEAHSASAPPPQEDTSAAQERVRTDEEEPLMEAERRIGDAVETGRWAEAVRGLGLDGLDQLLAQLENARVQVAELERNLAAAEEESTADSSRSC